MESGHKSDSPTDALRRAVAALGSQASMARLLDLTQPAISTMLRRKRPLPAEYVLKVEAATGVSKFELRPDIYQRETTPAPQPAITGMEPAR